MNFNRTNERKWFHSFKKKKKRQEADDISQKTITDVDYTDDQVLLASTSAQAKSLLHNLEQAARRIDPNMNSDKTEFMCFNQDAAICSSLNSKPLKLIDQFIYLNKTFKVRLILSIFQQ